VIRLAVIAAAAFALAGASSGSIVRGSGCADVWAVLVDARTGAVDCTSPGPDQYLTAAIADGAGGWYAAGPFRQIGGASVTRLAHLDPTGKAEPAFRADAAVQLATTIALHGPVLYVAWLRGVAALDAHTGRLLWKTKVQRWQTAYSGCCASVNQILYANGLLYVVGDYKLIGDVARHDVAALDPRTGRPTKWAVQVGPAAANWKLDRDNDGDVLSVAARNGTLYFGGEFDRIGGAPRLDLAAVDARTGRATAWKPHVENSIAINQLVIVGNQVVVGGHAQFAAFDLRTARRYAWPSGLFGSVAHLDASGNTLYLGGSEVDGFQSVGNREANNLASVRLPGGRFTSWTPNISTVVNITALAASGSRVLVAGGFCATSGAC
jgi:outer membrane protein assembly factor BamB